MDCFKIDNNKIYILYEPINDLDIFAKNCMEMLAENCEEDVYVIMDDSVDTISSAYIGVLMSCAMLSNLAGKKLHIKCNENLKRIVNMLDGHKLMEFINNEQS